MSSKHSLPSPPRDHKHKNCAEKFKHEHEAEYLAREKHGRHLIQEVENHNATYPKLREELRRKQSVTNNNVLRNHGKSYCKGCKRPLDYNTRIGSKTKLHSIKKKDHLRRRKPLVLRCMSNCSKLNMHGGRTQRKCMKPKNNSNWSCPRCTKIYHMNNNPGNADSFSVLCNQKSICNSSHSTISLNLRASDRIPTTCPDSKDPSVSSYHSFGSNNQEPLG